MLSLRDYQERSLETLEAYLRDVVEFGAQRAFVLQTNRPYVSVPRLPALPYVCLRVPTGGGKTIMAAHAVGIAARAYLHAKRAVCLWLVPSNAIRQQTLKALRDRDHPYRQVLDNAFPGAVRPVDLGEALYLTPAAFQNDTIIFVTTLASLRREDPEGLRAYRQASNFDPLVREIPAACAAEFECYEGGGVIPSLANALRLHRPLVIVDEAHNARTPLSFDTLARFNPSCIIEFTATPQTVHQPDRDVFASNILKHVSAAELKHAEMVKLPIKLRTHAEWKEVISAALAMQRELEAAALAEERETGEYIRPLVLIQAQPRSAERETLTVEVVKQCLVDDFKLPDDQIAIATGSTREIDDVDLFARTCPLRFIITVQALKEGWDCSFAYVLCSVANFGSSRAVEQVLGRVLRMPGARRKRRPELNSAYAFAAAPRFIEAAQSLRDTLVESLGFQRMEAGDFVRPEETAELWEHGTLFAQPSVVVTPGLSADALPVTTRENVRYEPATGQLVAVRALTEADRDALRGWCPTPVDQHAVDRLYDRSRGRTVVETAPERQAEPFRVPWLAIRAGEQLELFEADHFLDTDWNLAECDARLSEAEFPSERTAGATGEIDVSETGQLAMTQFVAQVQEQLMLLTVEPGWTVASLANWLDRQIPHPDIPLAYSSLFIHNAIVALLESRGLTVEQLARHKFRLSRAIEAKIAEHRKRHAATAYQSLLFGAGSGRIAVSADLALTFAPDNYSPNWYYDGGYRWQRHFFRTVGELAAEGEEFECAQFIDSMSAVKRWVRNLDRRADSSFWLQTATDRFYPDFVAELADGRILVVEYKGEHLWGAPDAAEKLAVGKLWAERSGGRCIFVMPRGKQWNEISASIPA